MHCLVYSLFPADGSAEAAARAMIAQRLAACCNLLPTGLSIYEWEGKTYEEPEVVLVCKTTQATSEALMAALRQLHSYECPAIVRLPIDGGYAPFLAWIGGQCAGAAIPD